MMIAGAPRLPSAILATRMKTLALGLQSALRVTQTPACLWVETTPPRSLSLLSTRGPTSNIIYISVLPITILCCPFYGHSRVAESARGKKRLAHFTSRVRNTSHHDCGSDVVCTTTLTPSYPAHTHSVFRNCAKVKRSCKLASHFWRRNSKHFRFALLCCPGHPLS